MYLTIKETAEYLALPESYVAALIREKRIRAVSDGEQYLINKEQFNQHFEQLEKAKQLLEIWRNEPIPEDYDVKDED
ncbi:excisionase family DNA-binding protein [Scopulibacillus cellulosilyticus]|uniref:Excisionase family DNA-binding protein n=1 Tax=Scopulibacillus cellulosilyticus TaxID=2665665 RepID=A0ABW2PWP1_9BACL